MVDAVGACRFEFVTLYSIAIRGKSNKNVKKMANKRT